MPGKRRYHYHKKKKKHRKKALVPGADSKLKKIFAGIGVPAKKPFVPDPFQLEAIEVIKEADCLVTAPTGAGKTWIAIQAISGIFENQGRAWYASPLKALTNSKYREFSEIFGKENVGILTGDRKENPDAPIIVGTTEILRNQLYDAMHKGEDLDTDFVVIDEAHYLGDQDRGVVWEETMIYLPPRIPLLLLSATIGNARSIAAWLASIRGRRCIIVSAKKRPVPLFPLFLHPSGTLFPLLSEMKKKGKRRIYKKVAKSILSDPKGRGFGGQLPPTGEILSVLMAYNLLPVIFFLKSRADCDNALVLCQDYTPRESKERKALREKRVLELIRDSHRLSAHKQLEILIEKGVAAHHSGHLPGWKLLVETLMTEGLLDAVFATSTVAAGVNFPARTVIFFNSDRFNGREFIPLTPTEFHQMTGRAGRRGMDKIGFAVVVPGRFMDTKLVAELFHTKPSDVNSQIKINFSMVLNLLLSHKPEQIKNMLEKSFAAFQLKRKRKKKPKQADIPSARQLWRDFLRHLAFLKEKGFVDENEKLTADGAWASQLRIDHPLMVAEGFRRRLLPESDPALLAGIMASFVNERETDDETLDPSEIPPELEKSFSRIVTGLAAFAKEMRNKGFSAPEFFLRPAVAMHAWAKGTDWERVLEIADTAEGDLAMLVMRTADNLRHIIGIKEFFPKAAASASEAVSRILREPVMPGFGEPLAEDYSWSRESLTKPSENNK